MKKTALSILATTSLIGVLLAPVGNIFASTNEDPLQYPHNGGAYPAKSFLNSGTGLKPYDVFSQEAGDIDNTATIQYNADQSKVTVSQWFQKKDSVNDPSASPTPTPYHDGFVQVGNGSPNAGNIYRCGIYSDMTMSVNNGYFLVYTGMDTTSSIYDPRDFIAPWTNLLGGNIQYVNSQIHDANEGFIYIQNGSPTEWIDGWYVRRFADLVELNGAVIVKGQTDTYYMVDPANPTQAEQYIQVLPTPVPKAYVKTDKTTYGVGSGVTITGSADDYTNPNNPDSNQSKVHYAAIEITGPNGFDKFIEGTGSSFSQMYRSDGGGSGDPTTPKTVTDTLKFDTTGLAQGTYTVRYYMSDNVGRAASNTFAQSTFSLDNSAPTGNGPTQTGVTGSPLTMKFGEIPATRKGQSTSVPVIVSNSGDKAVTTTLTFTLSGTMPQSYQQAVTTTSTDPSTGKTITTTTYVTKYANHPLTQTISKTITIPAYQTTTWVIWSGLTDTISGGNPSTYAGDSLNVYGAADENGVYLPDAYSPTIQIQASDAADYTSPTINDFIPTDGSINDPGHGVLTGCLWRDRRVCI